MLVLPHGLQKVSGWSCSSQQWHPRRLHCDCPSNSYGLYYRLYRLWRVVKAHLIVEVQHPQWKVVIQPSRHGHKLPSRNRVTWWPVTGGLTEYPPPSPKWRRRTVPFRSSLSQSFRDICFQGTFGIYFSWKAKERNASVFVALLSTPLVY